MLGVTENQNKVNFSKGGTCLYVLDIALEVSKEEGFGDGVIKARMAHWTAATTTTTMDVYNMCQQLC